MSLSPSVPVDSNQVAPYITAASSEEQSVFYPATSCSPYNRFRITLSEVKYCNERFELNDPIILTLYPNPDEDGWICEQPDFAIMAFGDSIALAAYSLCEDFSVMWREIAQSPDEALTPDAQQVKQNMLRAVRSINPR